MDLLLIPTQIIIIIAYVFRISLANTIFKIPFIKKPKNLNFLDFILSVLTDMKIGIDKSWKTILIPILTIFAFYLGWVLCNIIFLQRLPIPPSYESILIYIMDSLILAPISEEIIQCFLLSWIFVLSTSMMINRRKIIGVNFVVLIISSVICTIGHTNFNPISFLQIFCLFVIYGAMYYLNNRNLLPAIIAHSTWNLLAIIKI